ncbi:GFA family protein [Jannaschia sp. LMIT008]|uniref:GFA family protein n=1 Tax=Jannaschia maritima TaxID=3032585 RepID=UPI0028124E2D|nr:GFA family protein [Jannaschia sp. LMIT008]
MTDRKGSCLCGAVRFTVAGPMRPVVACHCGQCRKATGNYVAATSAPRDAVAVTGDVTWFRSSESARRGFCGLCGSNLFCDGPGANLSVMAGALDDAAGLRLAGHIFCADKGAWYDIDGDLPRYPRSDDDMTTQVPVP